MSAARVLLQPVRMSVHAEWAGGGRRVTVPTAADGTVYWASFQSASHSQTSHAARCNNAHTNTREG